MWELDHKEGSESHSVVSDSLQPHGLYIPWNSPGQNTRVGSSSLLQGIFSTQGSDPDLPHGRQMLYQLSHQGSSSSRLLDWVAISFPEDLPDPGIKQGSPALQADSLSTELSGKPKDIERLKAQDSIYIVIYLIIIQYSTYILCLFFAIIIKTF